MKRIEMKKLLVVAIVMGLLLPIVSQAATLKLWMDQFKKYEQFVDPTSSSKLVYVSPASVLRENGVTPQGWMGWAPVSLAAGRTITKVVYYHKGSASACTLYRVAMGSEAEELAGFVASSSSGWEKKTLNPKSGADLVVRPGYRYYVVVQVSITGSWAAVGGVKVKYQ